MTPKEKADQLIEKYIDLATWSNDWRYARKCALIVIDEMLHELTIQFGKTAVDYGREAFWLQVREEIYK